MYSDIHAKPIRFASQYLNRNRAKILFQKKYLSTPNTCYTAFESIRKAHKKFRKCTHNYACPSTVVVSENKSGATVKVYIYYPMYQITVFHYILIRKSDSKYSRILEKISSPFLSPSSPSSFIISLFLFTPSLTQILFDSI